MAVSEKTGLYLILTLNPVTKEWREAGTGKKAEDVLGENHSDIVYVKVPLRSWEPRVRESVTITRTRTQKWFDNESTDSEVTEA